MTHRFVKLGSVCEFYYGNGLPERSRSGGNVPVYGSNGIVGWHSSGITSAPVLIIGRKGSIGEVHYSNVSCWPIDTTYYVDHTKQPCDLKWLYYILLALDLNQLNKAAAVPGLNRNDAYDQVIPLPPLAEQQRIAGILARADRLRQLRHTALQLSEGYLQSVFLQLFGDPVTNPMGWPKKQVEKVLSKTRAGTRTGPFGSSLKRHEYVESGIPVWQINNVRPNEFIEKNPLFITPEKYQQLTNYSVEAGDILISRAGTVGRMCVAHPSTTPSIIGTNLVRVSLDNQQITPEYFVALFTYFGEVVGNLRRTGDENAYSFLNPSNLKVLSIPLPSIGKQNEYIVLENRFRRLRSQQHEAARQANHLFATLLHRAFRGEL